MPWRFDTKTHVGGKEVQLFDTEIINIAGMGGMTHNGRVFTPKYPHRVSPSPTVVPHKEKVLLVPPS